MTNIAPHHHHQHAQNPYRTQPSSAKTFFVACFGAVAGTALTLAAQHWYFGGAEMQVGVKQIETTIEHDRQVTQELLSLAYSINAVLKSTEDAQERPARISTQPAASAGSLADRISKNPSEHELTSAIDALFEGVDESEQHFVWKMEAEEASPSSATQADDAHPEQPEDVKGDEGVEVQSKDASNKAVGGS